MDELIQVPLLNGHTKKEIIDETAVSISTVRKIKRFEAKEENGNVFVRATYGHRLQRVNYKNYS